MEEEWSHGSVVGSCVMFGVVISAVDLPCFPKDMELTLAYSVSNPVEAHVNGAGSALFRCFIEDALGG
jgi:hypothetical protein